MAEQEVVVRRWWIIWWWLPGDSGSRKSGGGPLFVLLLVFIAIASGAHRIEMASAASADPGATGARAVTTVGADRSIRAGGRLVGSGARVEAHGTDDSADCVRHSYGQVHDFFREHPCTALHRAYFRIRDHEGHVVLVAASWVQMPDEAGARELKRLVDVHGAGNVTELSREQGGYRTVRYTGDACSSRRDGTVVATAQAQPVAGGATGLALSTIASEAIR